MALDKYSRLQRLSLFGNIGGLNTKASHENVRDGELTDVNNARYDHAGAIRTSPGWKKLYQQAPPQHVMLMPAAARITISHHANMNRILTGLTVEAITNIVTLHDTIILAYKGSNWSFRVHSNGSIWLKVTEGGAGSIDYYSKRRLDIGKQYHIVAAWKKNNYCRFYVAELGEVLERDSQTATTNNNLTTSADNVLVGHAGNVDAFYLKEVRVWESQRSDEELRMCANGTLDPAEHDKLCIYMPLDEGENVFVERSPYRHTSWAADNSQTMEVDSAGSGMAAGLLRGTNYAPKLGGDAQSKLSVVGSSRHDLGNAWEIEHCFKIEDFDSAADQALGIRASAAGYHFKVYVRETDRKLVLTFNDTNGDPHTLASDSNINAMRKYAFNFQRIGADLALTLFEEDELVETKSIATCGTLDNETAGAGNMEFWGEGAGSYFNGWLGEFRIWKVASRAQNVIEEDLARRLPYLNRTGLVLYFSFNQPHKSTDLAAPWYCYAADWSPMGYTCAVTGTPTWAASTLRVVGGQEHSEDDGTVERLIAVAEKVGSNNILLGYKLYRLIHQDSTIGFYSMDPIKTALESVADTFPVFHLENGITYITDGVNKPMKYNRYGVSLLGVEKPPDAPTPVAAGVGGLAADTYSFKVTFNNPQFLMESNASTSADVVVGALGRVEVGLPNVVDPRATTRELYYKKLADNQWCRHSVIYDPLDTIVVVVAYSLDPLASPSTHYPPPRSKFLMHKEGRMYYGGAIYRNHDLGGDVTADESWPNYLYYSEIYDSTDAGNAFEYVNPSNWIPFDTGDGDALSGIMESHDNIYVYKRRRVGILLGSTSSDYEIRWLNMEAGVASQRALVYAGEEIYFIGENGIWRQRDTSIVKASLSIEPTLDALGSDYINRAAGAYWRVKSEVWFTMGSADENSVLIKLDIFGGMTRFLKSALAISAIWRMKAGDAFYSGDYQGLAFEQGVGNTVGSPEAQNYGTAAAGAGSQQTNGCKDVSLSMVTNSCIGLKLMIVHDGSALDPGGIEEKTVISNTATQWIVDANWVNKPVNDHTKYYLAPLDFYFDTKWMSFGGPSQNKRILWVILHLNPLITTGDPIMLQISNYADFSDTPVATYEVDVLNQRMVKIGLRQGARARYHKLRIALKSSDMPAEVNGLEIDYTFGRRR